MVHLNEKRKHKKTLGLSWLLPYKGLNSNFSWIGKTSLEMISGNFGYIQIVCNAYVTYSDRLWNAKHDSCFYLSLKFHLFNNSSLSDECARESFKKYCLSLSAEALKTPIVLMAMTLPF